MKRRALITGITGQDGSYLAELLLEKDYEVYGLVRSVNPANLWRLASCVSRVHLIPGDVTDAGSLHEALQTVGPHEVYHLAAQSHVGQSFRLPGLTGRTTGLGTLNLLEAVRLQCPDARVYHASSSEQFGNTPESPQSETTPFQPVSPYGCAKTYAHFLAEEYRRAYGLQISCGIAFNHESPRRGEEFVTRKITRAIGAIKAGTQTTLRLGDLTASRDWSHAKDIVEAMWRMLQLDQPQTLVLASGTTHTVREFVELAFNAASLSWHEALMTDPTLYRPVEVHTLCGHPALARRLLSWTPRYTFAQLVEEMVDADTRALAGDSQSHHGRGRLAAAACQSVTSDAA